MTGLTGATVLCHVGVDRSLGKGTAIARLHNMVGKIAPKLDLP